MKTTFRSNNGQNRSPIVDVVTCGKHAARFLPFVPAAFPILLALAFSPSPLPAAEVWDGPVIQFSKPIGADWTQPENQDRITDNVWITRDLSQGLFNARFESSYTHLSSPAGTEWAYGTLEDFATLTYQNWEAWHGGAAAGGPPTTVGRDAVLHLIEDDIYLGIRFTTWGGVGGAYSYERTTLVPEPSSVWLMLGGIMTFAATRVRNRVNKVPS